MENLLLNVIKQNNDYYIIKDNFNNIIKSNIPEDFQLEIRHKGIYFYNNLFYFKNKQVIINNGITFNVTIYQNTKNFSYYVCKDYLTKTLKRDYFETVLNYHVLNNNLFYLLLIDIDDFKAINDSYGHLAGDKALQVFSSSIKDNLNETSIIGRWGGDEFMIMLFDTNVNEIINLFEKIKTNLSKQNSNINFPINISAGILKYNNKETYNNNFEKLDQLLYEAKQTGKNKIIFEKQNNI